MEKDIDSQLQILKQKWGAFLLKFIDHDMSRWITKRDRRKYGAVGVGNKGWRKEQKEEKNAK